MSNTKLIKLWWCHRQKRDPLSLASSLNFLYVFFAWIIFLFSLDGFETLKNWSGKYSNLYYHCHPQFCCFDFTCLSSFPTSVFFEKDMTGTLNQRNHRLYAQLKFCDKVNKAVSKLIWIYTVSIPFSSNF